MPQSKPAYGRIELHGWDSRSRAWHGPDEISFTLAGTRRILNKLRELAGCWHGKLQAQGPGVPPLTFCAQIYDLGDAGLATVDMEGSPAGPLEIMLAIPPQRRARLRPELAFEFASYLRFLEGPESQGVEMAIHDHVENAIRESDPATTLLISVEMRFLTPEVHILVADAAGKLAMSLIAWLAEKDGVAAVPR
ncbi:MAG: hypothetical protein LAQ30_22695 [Acidobacteriia bacterium]|nr:hypothetical protein [Terriglobia bacterium]